MIKRITPLVIVIYLILMNLLYIEDRFESFLEFFIIYNKLLLSLAVVGFFVFKIAEIVIEHNDK